jgi:hypothetical protein
MKEGSHAGIISDFTRRGREIKFPVGPVRTHGEADHMKARSKALTRTGPC